MAYKKRKESVLESDEINLTPLIDAVFLLLIFFMVTTVFKNPAQLKMTLPDSIKPMTLEKKQLVAEVDEDPENKSLIIQVEDTDTGQLMTKVHDLLIISPGLQPPEDLGDLAEELGIDLADDGYIKVRDGLVAPVDTGKDGVYVCGCADGPKDIPDSVTAGSAAAMRATILLGQVSNERSGEQ